MANSSVTRLDRLRCACQEQGIDAFLVRDTSNIRWLTAFDGVFDSEAAHGLFVSSDRAVLHTDSRYSAAARMAAETDGVIAVDDSRVSHAKFALSAVLDGANGANGAGATLGIEDSVSLAEFRALEKEIAASSAADVHLQDTNGLIVGLRAVKDAEEIRRMRAAQAVTDAAFSHIVAFMKPGMTEREVQLELDGFMRRHGAEDLAFASIVATGANGANPHAIPNDTRLEAGQCVVLDFGAKVHGYCSDMTRTVFLGRPQGDMLRAWDTMRRANEEVQELLRPGVTGKEAHDLAERILEEGGFGGKMGHGLGHGVGLDIHEQPNLNPRNDQPLAVGNVVTVEPGIYLPGRFGMRLEDFGVITQDGFCRFTQSTHEMVVL